jgi:hypothetical protein
MFSILNHRGNAKKHVTLIRMAFIKKTTTNAGKDTRRKENSYIVSENVN